MGSGPSRLYRDGLIVMLDDDHTGQFQGPLRMGRVNGACAAMARNNYEYTIQLEDGVAECIEEQYVSPLRLPELEWVSGATREVAVWVETHGEKRFAANLIKRDSELCFEVRFLSDGTIITGVTPDHLSMPDSETIYSESPETAAPDPLWLLDRKIQQDIDAIWPMPVRIKDAFLQLQTRRPSTAPPLRGPFVGKNLYDSEGFPAHPAPLQELSVDGFFIDTWAKYAGKVKFATTHKIGPSHPRYDCWVTQVDAGEPLYFHAALPVYAGLICLGRFQGQPEWVRARDIALIGIALYVNGELHPGFVDPPLEKDGFAKHGHECCHFIPGCVSTFLGDCLWVGGIFCLAPQDDDYEVADDIYSIQAYHRILQEWANIQAAQGEANEITIEVNLLLSTNYLANIRQICTGAIKVQLTDRGLMVANQRMHDVMHQRLYSKAACYPRRPRKVLAEKSHEQRMEVGPEGEPFLQPPPSPAAQPSSPGSPAWRTPKTLSPARGERGNLRRLANHPVPSATPPLVDPSGSRLCTPLGTPPATPPPTPPATPGGFIGTLQTAPVQPAAGAGASALQPSTPPPQRTPP